MPKGLFISHKSIFEKYSKCRTLSRPARISGQPFAVVSDIHGNLPALEAVINHITFTAIPKYGVSDIICLGDIVGYGPRPKECLNIVKKWAPKIWVKGNHDFYASGDDSLENYSPEAAETIKWTRNQLRREDREFLASLPFKAEYNKNIFIAHGCYGVREEMCIGEYLSDANNIATKMVELSFSEYSMGIFGHTHQQWIAHKGIHTFKENCYLPEMQGFIPPHSSNGKITKDQEYEYILANEVHFLNPGSVGQPRDFEPAAAYAVVVPPEKIILFRIPYDVEETKTAIRTSDIDAKIARMLINRLDRGM